MTASQNRIKRAAVLGAGVMGAAISAHLANAGIQTLLLDRASPETEGRQAGSAAAGSSPAPSRNRLVLEALARLPKQKPAPLFTPEVLNRIEPGNFEDDMGRIVEADWIIEAVTERLDVKRELLARVEQHWRPGTIVSSNTSGISIRDMAEGRSEAFQAHFLGTHFFNPPRYMKLVELIPLSETDPAVVERLDSFLTLQLGKGTVRAKDTPNFIANRIGTYGLLVTIQEMERFGLSVSEVDALTGPIVGRPKSATFRTLDLVGLDTFLHVAANVEQRTEDAAERAVFAPPRLLLELVHNGALGEKAGRGLYHVEGSGQAKSILQWDPQAGEYVPKSKRRFGCVEQARRASALPDKLKIMTQGKDDGSRFVWEVLKRQLLYAAARLPEVADDLPAVDQAMKWGFGWELGPFELWDALGLETVLGRIDEDGDGAAVPIWVRQLAVRGEKSFYNRLGDGQRVYALAHSDSFREEMQPESTIDLAVLKEQGRIIRRNSGACLIDLGDDVACLEFTSPNHAIGPDILQMLFTALEEVRANYRGLVIGNQGRHFCVGANLMLLLMEAQDGNWPEIDFIIRQFQQASLAVKYAEKPVVSAPYGMTLGGGAELCLPAARVQASAETYMGLVETGVGLIPAGGGTKELLLRFTEAADFDGKVDLQPYVNRALETIGLAKVSGSAQEARKLGLLRERDGITMNSDRLLYEAKQAVLGLSVGGYTAPEKRSVRAVGEPGFAVMQLGLYQLHCAGQISGYDRCIGEKLARVLAGGSVTAGTQISEERLLDLEREVFLSLCGEPKTQARMQHMLATGEPLRN